MYEIRQFIVDDIIDDLRLYIYEKDIILYLYDNIPIIYNFFDRILDGDIISYNHYSRNFDIEETFAYEFNSKNSW